MNIFWPLEYMRGVLDSFRSKWMKDMARWAECRLKPDPTDPVKNCPVYLDKNNGSCCHVDGPLCKYPGCSDVIAYKERKLK